MSEVSAHVSRSELAEVLSNIGRVVPARSSNPILTYITMQFTEGDSLIMSGSDMDVDVEVKLQGDPIDYTGTATLAVPGDIFRQVIKATKDEVVSLTFVDNELEVSSGSFKTKLQVYGEDKTTRTEFPTEYKGKIGAKEFISSLDRVRYAASSAEYQQIFRGVYTLLKPDSTEIVATDGFRMAMDTISGSSGLDGSVVIPSKRVVEIKAMMSGTEDIQLSLGDDSTPADRSGTRLYLYNGKYKLCINLMEGKYPDYERVIPANFEVEFLVDSDTIKDIISRIAVLADKATNNRVNFKLIGEQLSITAEGPYGQAEETITVEVEDKSWDHNKSIDLAYNASYLLDVLKTIPETVKVSVSGKTSPTLFRSIGDTDSENLTGMVVPLRT